MEDIPPQFRAGIFFTGVTVAVTTATVLAFEVIPNFTPMTAVSGLGYAAAGAFGYKVLKDVLLTDENEDKRKTAEKFMKKHPDLKADLVDVYNLERNLNEHECSLEDIMTMERRTQTELKVKDLELIKKYILPMAEYNEGFYHFRFDDKVENANEVQRFRDFSSKVDALAKENKIPKEERISNKEKDAMFSYYDLGLKQCAPEFVYSQSLLKKAERLLDSAEEYHKIDIPKELVTVEKTHRNNYEVTIGNKIYSMFAENPPKENNGMITLSFYGESMERVGIIEDGVVKEKKLRFKWGYCDFLDNLENVAGGKYVKQENVKQKSEQEEFAGNTILSMINKRPCTQNELYEDYNKKLERFGKVNTMEEPVKKKWFGEVLEDMIKNKKLRYNDAKTKVIPMMREIEIKNNRSNTRTLGQEI